jgi:predicted enzyme related to lactoylglutathione lyase
MLEGGFKMPRVIHFNIQADDPQQALDFYAQVFGWEFEKVEGAMEYWMADTGDPGEPGISAGVGLRNPNIRFNAFVNTISVENVDDYVVKIKMSGGKTLSPKIVIPGVGYYVPCQDTEGNTFGILEPDESV